MAYNKVNISTNLHQIENTVKQAKSGGQYDGNEATFDNQIIRSVDTDQKIAEGYIESNAQLVQGKAVKCKERIAVIENLAKQKSVTEEDVKLAKLSTETIIKYAGEIHDDNKDLNNALKSEYRGGWPAIAKSILHDKAKIEPFMAIRLKGINTGKNIPALTARCDQYVKRAKEFLKQIVQTQKAGGVEVAQFQKDCDDILGKMTKKKGQIEALQQKVNSHFDFFLKTLKKKKDKDLEKSDYDNGSSRIADVNARAKEARGIFKTMTVQYDGLKKRAKAAGPGWKEPALRAVKNAKTEFDAAEKVMNKFNDDEKECVKLLEKVKKKVG